MFKRQGLEARKQRQWVLRGCLVTLLGCALLAPAQAQLVQVGGKLFRTPAPINSGAAQGYSAAMAASGVTAIWGGPNDNSGTGYAAVATFSAGSWSNAAVLIGSFSGNSSQGGSVALSADGSTAAVGGPILSAGGGAVWIYTRNLAGTWSEQARLIAGDAVGAAAQGYSVALSSDGNTVAIGGPTDNSGVGAVWMWTRPACLDADHFPCAVATWTNVAKVTGTGASGAAQLGTSVALSGDGNILVAGGEADNSNKGAAWIFKRRDATFSCTNPPTCNPLVQVPAPNVWTQQGAKLSAADATAGARQGHSVAIAVAGSTAIVGGHTDNAGVGAAWIYTITPAVPTPLPPADAQVVIAPQGGKLVGTGATGTAAQGRSVAIASDGNTALVGGAANNTSVGGAWEWNRTGTTWAQRGAGPLVGTGNNGASQQGYAVGLSGDGNKAIMGGPTDNSTNGAPSGNGAVWFYGAPGAPDLTISKVHNGTFHRGDTGVTYTLRVTNSGTASTNGTTVTVVDTLPAGLTATTLSGTGWGCVLGTLTCTRTDVLAAGSPYPDITLTVNVAGSAPSNLINRASVSGGGELLTTNNDASDYVALPLAPDLTLIKSHVGAFAPGQAAAAYSIIVRNVGSGPSSGLITVSDPLPVTLTGAVIAASQNGWSCTGGATISCTRSDVLAGGGAFPAIRFTVNVSGGASGSISNTATVSGGADVNAANNSYTDVANIGSGADLTIFKGHAGTFLRGQTSAYTLTIQNVGSALTAGLVTVTDTLPAGLTVVSMTGTGWYCAPFLAPMTCVRGDALAPGGSYPPIRITVSIGAGTAGLITNVGNVSGGGDVNPGNNSSSDLTVVH